ncbi:sulfite exporter TauE/SafE [Enterococcus haemoperoxidus ATCC BAA-382]|uniref:Probable membrane transporter protein n=1 Tax=Enterococcus haemoperoxidus ATCC BAA-382 TaxID=1158608 RepID=R2QNH4_9ENTE|nr:sulfite exporter TauE/SafE family protein [Enterococcus haemoperoxidus]EOH96763.1 sulfite exporter TauE/SafE [Enterococcus haemoperoxidus ATCC BAA-382]EOT60052.1 sulfite exporter TauE/SafE [Enterococcus haemoperoxidus ATCC BAA-382]OJG56232.1 sulfite exporter TauE/SafE [Enterococcus haemoperoxidus]
MHIGIIYFIVIILANTVGAISGMGGGVIIKPVLDTLHFHPLAAISFYSSVAVFTMSIVSTLRQMKNGLKLQLPIAFFVSLGSVIGGILGNTVFESLLRFFSDEKYVQLIQIILTIVTLLFAYFYTKIGNDRSFDLSHPIWYVSIGLFLGFISTLLGIGGGPINVALLMLCFGIPIKEATVYSIITIFFSQAAKLFTIAQSTGFGRFDLTILFYVIPAAVIGGFVGALISGKISSERVTQIYQVVILLVLLLNLWNGVQLFV